MRMRHGLLCKRARLSGGEQDPRLMARRDQVSRLQVHYIFEHKLTTS